MLVTVVLRIIYFTDEVRANFRISLSDYQELNNLAQLYGMGYVTDAVTILLPAFLLTY